MRFFSQFAYKVLLIFPPRNNQGIFLQIQMQIFFKRNIKLLHSFRVNESARFSCLFVKPICYICSCGMYNRLNFSKMPIFLYKVSQIIDIIEKSNPNIVRGVVTFKLGDGIVSSFVIRFGNEFFDIICCTLSTHIKYTL